ncbi:MAG: hypothetical protein RL764_103 [Pseudomonadota bacterium]|jgi:hypothetical protein
MNGGVLKLAAVGAISLVLVGCDSQSSKARAVISGEFDSISYQALNMQAMEAFFGQSKVDEWRSCVVETTRQKYSDSEIAGVQEGGLYSTPKGLKNDIWLATADCIDSSTIPEEGRSSASSFSSIIRLMVKQRQAFSQISGQN